MGLLYGALGLGATAGTVALGSLRGLRHPGLWGGLTLLGLGLALASTAAAPTVAWAAAALALAGLLRGAGANIYITLVQAHAPDAARGRVMGLFMLGVMGLAPLSMAAGGLLGASWARGRCSPAGDSWSPRRGPSPSPGARSARRREQPDLPERW